MGTNLYARSANAVSCPLGEGVAILDTAMNVYFSLNAAGAIVWEALDTPQRAETLVAKLVDTFDVSTQVASLDVDAILAKLCAQGLATAADVAEPVHSARA